MPETPDPHATLIDAIRAGDAGAWQALIAKFEGRLLAFAESRLRDRASSEDIVQETFIGFLTSLPNYDSRRPLEGYLFSICAYKLTDHLRKMGRRPPLVSTRSREGDDLTMQLPGSARVASSIVRSGERKRLEEEGQTYKKGYEVRLVVSTLREAAQIRKSLKEVGLKGGKPFKKAKQWAQPVYGQAAVKYFQRFVK